MENTEISQIINLFGCKKTTVIIKGKVNAVTLGSFAFSAAKKYGFLYSSLAQ